MAPPGGLPCRRAATRRTKPDPLVYPVEPARVTFSTGSLVSKPKALITRPLFPAARAILDHHFEAEYWTPQERIQRSELLKRVADKDALVCLLTEKVDEELL